MRRKNSPIVTGDVVRSTMDFKPHILTSNTYEVKDTRKVKKGRKHLYIVVGKCVIPGCKCIGSWWPSEYFTIVKRDTAQVILKGRETDETSGVDVQGQGMAASL
jgi:hypothetical protein